MGDCPSNHAAAIAPAVARGAGRRRAAVVTSLIACAAGLLVGAATAPSASAQLRAYTVMPGESIQRAIDAAAPGATITIAPGVYSESIVVYKAGLTVQGAGVTLRPATRIGAPFGVCVSYSPGCLSFYDTPVVGVTVKGITVDHAPGDGFLAYKSGQTAFVDDVALHSAHAGFAVVRSTEVTLAGDRAEASADSGFSIESAAGITVDSVRSTDNRSIGISVLDSVQASVSTATATGNCAGLTLAYTENATVADSSFAANTRRCPALVSIPTTSGVGVLVNSSSAVTVTHNTLSANGAADPNAIAAGLAVVRSVPGAANVFLANVTSNNRAVDIRTDDRDPATNRFTGNTCRTSAPAGLC